MQQHPISISFPHSSDALFIPFRLNPMPHCVFFKRNMLQSSQIPSRVLGFFRIFFQMFFEFPFWFHEELILINHLKPQWGQKEPIVLWGNQFSFISSQRLVISGTIPPSQYLRTPSPTKPFNKSAGSLAPPCCRNFVLRASPVLNDNGSSLHTFCHMLAAKHLEYK